MTVVEDVEMAENAPVAVVPFATVRILQVVKDAQQMHGLRHGDYNRYRTFCRSKLRRVRHVLKFTNTHKCVRRHKAKFVKKWVTEENFVDEKFIFVGLFEAERSWAQAMADKMTVEDNADKLRKRHAMRMNLKRAVLHAKNLEALVRNNERCDATTKLEAQAYTSWLLGICNFELRQWKEASEALKAARAVYEGLGEATHNTTLANIYKAKCREIQPQLRLCEFNSAEVPSEASMSELMAIRLQIGGGENVDKLIAEVRSKATADDVIVIEWGGERSTVDDEKARQVVQGWKQTDAELAQCQSPKEKMALYEKQLADTRDAIEKMSDLIRRKTADNTDSSVLRNIKTYLEYMKMSGTISRYLAMIENTKSEKKTKPQDLLRLYDSVIELCKEVIELPGAEMDKDLTKAYSARVEYYRTFRCHYMAAAYAFLGKYSEAAALFERAKKRNQDALKLISAIKGNTHLVNETKAALEVLAQANEQARLAARAKRMSEAAGVAEETGDAQTAKKIDERPLMETLDEWRSWNVASRRALPVMRMPPAFLAMPNKPLFFDLANNHIKMPDLQERLEKCIEGAKASQPTKKKTAASAAQKSAATAGKTTAEEEQGGLSGMLKRFWN